MNSSNLMKQLVAIGLGIAVACLGPSALAAQGSAPGSKTIRVLSAPGTDAASPEAAIWKRAPVTQVALQPAFPGYPSIVGTPVTQQLTAQAVRADGRLFVRLTWSDSTANTAIKDTNQFVDGAAVQFPVNGRTTTSPFMGDAQNTVNIWHWLADGRTENILAQGFGTATVMPLEGLRSTSLRTRDGWEVVIARPLRVKSDDGVNLLGRHTIPVAFAVWDGANQERDGLKAVTLQWWQLRF